MGFFTLILLTSSCFLGKAAGKQQVQAEPSLVKAAVGDDVLLNCIFTVDEPTVDLSRLSILWFHRGRQLAEFDDVVTTSREGVSLSREELENGNASLLISRVGTGNSGNYGCYITYTPEVRIREVTLQVADPEEDLEDSFSSPCLSRSDILSKLGQIEEAVKQLEAKLQELVTSKSATRCSSEVASPSAPEPSR
ncbi:natural cytotoxicity triggering receptor 3 ligand 1-like [Podarcis lilfordi]|uniref:Natural cytotoxicity triggering receptor 3 ligand 1-like n=1 Tax=Podarcis lilfordi TaxID=74358 RepID=A0AA35PJQ7_9SAUR|nr:natural cytotoxicity triggering receptor 3 ligand 1-like [Podarcis lilfordi]